MFAKQTSTDRPEAVGIAPQIFDGLRQTVKGVFGIDDRIDLFQGFGILSERVCLVKRSREPNNRRRFS